MKANKLWLTLIFGIASISSASAQDANTETVQVIENIHVVDVEKGKLVQNQTIVIKGDRIDSVGRMPDSVPDSAIIVDGAGKYAIPGLWDMHIHWYDQKSMELFPLNGVVGVRVMWGMPMHHAWEKSFQKQEKLGPRMWIGGPIVDGSEPIWRGSIVAKDAEGGKTAVSKTVEAQSKFVKVYSLLSRDAYFAIAKEAKARKMDIAGHVPMMVSAWEASDAGQRSMEHMYEILLSCSREEDKLRARLTDRRKTGDSTRKVFSNRGLRAEIGTRAMETFDREKAEKLFAKFVENETYQCPTLTVLRNLAYLQEDVVQDNPNLKYVPTAFTSFLAPKSLQGQTEASIKRSRLLLKMNMELVAAMQKAGVPILAGTDCLNPFCLPGFSLHTELELLVKAGLKPHEALQSATVNAARYRREQKTSGVIAAGKVADIVILNDNPLKDITNTRKIDSVYLRGKRIDSEQLKKRLNHFDRTAKKEPAKQASQTRL